MKPTSCCCGSKWNRSVPDADEQRLPEFALRRATAGRHGPRTRRGSGNRNARRRVQPWIMTRPSLISCTVAILVLNGVVGADTPQAAASLASSPDARVFPPEALIAWRRHSFSGDTEYSLAAVDGVPAVHARCDDSASGLFFDETIDLEATPILEWRWRVDAVFPDAAEFSERDKAGDDFPARVYVVRESALPWRTRAVNYVWASGESVGADWPNPFARQAHMVVLQSGVQPSADEGAWRVERRDVRADFRQFHDRDLDRIDAVAIMTDCDNRAASAEAWYGEMRWLPDPLEAPR